MQVNGTRRDDLQLTAGDVGQLENAERVVAFFGGLGYDVDETADLDHGALGLDSEDLRQKIRRIRLIGSDPVDQEIRIYLFELRSVTVQLTQAIARRFRERPESALLVLTKDFDSLDFVLLDRHVTRSKGRVKAMKQIIRPRVLTVDRRKPQPVTLRVLKRFTFTEADGLFQWEKLRSAYTVAEWGELYFNNRALFSDYYLEQRLTDPELTPAWREDVRPIGREAYKHVADARPTYSGQAERVIRQGMYEPLFGLLGFEFEVNKAARSAAEEPDYWLHAPEKGDEPIAAALTYVWNRNLDDADPARDPDTADEIPGTLVVSVLEAGRAPWVIVTNGKLWRLYSASASNKATNYYEVDLEEAIDAADQVTALKYWWLFFRAEAFTGFLDDLLRKSADYAKDLGARLKDRVFETIFPHFAEGFIANMRAQAIDEIDLGLVFSGTMTFLYRLMFVLYAESLDLLPVSEERGYADLSLHRLKSELAGKAGDVLDESPERLKKGYGADSSALYERLMALFRVIDTGAEGLNMPAYNGGLFSAQTPSGRFLEANAIPDRYLVLGLDRLVRDVDGKTQALVMVDFKSLGVRHLGSIYEGLLEFKLRIADQKLAVVKRKGREVFVPHRKAKGSKVHAALRKGDVYLENDRRERKATGSYYTPDYIVKYIVEHTVGPVLDRKFEELGPRLRDAQKRYRSAAARAKTKGEDPEKFWNREQMRHLADDCLSVRVLDPAMGSGHFLVEAVDYASNRLITFLNAWSENPVWAMLEQTREDILEDMERQRVTIDADRLTRVALLKRAVLKRCVYGVDINEMAVELAKVSLWLDAFTLGAPLSFLDHHLKLGNSLIGSRVREVQEALAPKHGETFSLLASSKFVGVMLATDLMRRVSYLSDNTVAQVEASRAAYRDASDHLAPYKRILDVYTSRWFGNTPSKKGFDPTVDFLKRPEVEAWLTDPAAELPAKGDPDLRRVGETAAQAAEEKRFFHWELEFPEVFFAPSRPGGQDVRLREDGGFDAVVGNPPWVSLFGIKDSDRSVLRHRFSSPHGKYDIYVVFVELGLRLSRSGFGMLVPNRFLRSHYGGALRQVMLGTGRSWRLIEFATNDMFEGATTYPCIAVATSTNGSGELAVARVDAPQPRLSDVTNLALVRLARESLSAGEIHATPGRRVRGDRHGTVALSHLVEQIGQGVYTGAKDVFVVDDYGAMESDVLLPVVDGADLDRYVAPIPRAHLVYPYRLRDRGLELLDISDYPRARDYLSRFRRRLLERRFWGKTIASAGKRYYELWNPSPFMFTPKLVYAEIASAPTFTYDLDGDLACLKTCYCIVLKGGHQYALPYLAALLNSRLLFHWLKEKSPTMRGGRHYRFLTQYVEDLPVRRITFTTPGAARAGLVEEATRLYSRFLYTADPALLLTFTESQLRGEPDRSDVVHDLLAFLAQQMIDLNKQKQAEVRRFLEWLEERLAIRPKNDGSTGVDSLAGKTIIRNYLGDYQKDQPELPWKEFQYRLHQNRNRFGVPLAQVSGEIEGEYEQSLATLLPIKQQLAHTDDLIDKIVYQLYGLTDEEIELVERPQYEKALTDAKAKVIADKKLQQDPEAATDAIAAAFLPAARRLQSRVDFTADRERLDAELPGWNLLPEHVPTFLLTGEYNIRTQPEQLDFSTSVVSYAKAVETTLQDRLFRRFRDESGSSEEDCANKHLRQYVAGERDKLTLGSMSIIMQSSKEAALRRFAETLFTNAAQALFGPRGVLGLLADEASISLRNAAAHDTVVDREHAVRAREWALAVLRNL